MHMALNSHSLNSHNILFCLRSSKIKLSFSIQLHDKYIIINNNYIYNYNKYELLLVWWGLVRDLNTGPCKCVCSVRQIQSLKVTRLLIKQMNLPICLNKACLHLNRLKICIFHPCIHFPFHMNYPLGFYFMQLWSIFIFNLHQSNGNTLFKVQFYEHHRKVLFYLVNCEWIKFQRWGHLRAGYIWILNSFFTLQHFTTNRFLVRWHHSIKVHCICFS